MRLPCHNKTNFQSNALAHARWPRYSFARSDTRYASAIDSVNYQPLDLRGVNSSTLAYMDYALSSPCTALHSTRDSHILSKMLSRLLIITRTNGNWVKNNLEKCGLTRTFTQDKGTICFLPLHDLKFLSTARVCNELHSCQTLLDYSSKRHHRRRFSNTNGWEHNDKPLLNVITRRM